MKSIRAQAGAAILAITLLPALSGELRAGNRLLPFQGRLTTAGGSPLADGARVVQFKIYDAPVGGRAVWNGEVQNLSVNAGLVNTLLGTKASLEGVDFNLDLYLEVTVDANGDGLITLADPPLLPRQSILPAVFAKESANSQLLGGYDWSALFGTNNPAEGTFLDAKIRDGSITTAKLDDNAVTTSKIPNSAITRPKLDATGAQAGQSLMYDGTDVVWSQVNALNADNAANANNANLLDGFDWASFFIGSPNIGLLNVADANVRGSLSVGGGATISGNMALGPNDSSYRFLRVGGGNSGGFLYGSFPRFADGVHLGYNYYADANGSDRVIHSDGPTSRLTVGYGVVSMWLGEVGFAPTTERLRATIGGVTVFGTFNNSSDRNVKQDFSPVDPAQILDKVTQLPISEWSYKDDPATRHIGPMGQDFHSIFDIGTDDKHIAPIDEGGIALSAIQGLNTRVREQDAEIRELITQQQAQIDALKAQIAALQEARR
jgi:hypothetical protein